MASTASSKPASSRIEYSDAEGARELFTPEFCEYLAGCHDAFAPRLVELRRAREEVLRRAHSSGIETVPRTKPQVAEASWQVATVPEDLRRPGIEISGPASVTGMFINGLNPGPEGSRADGDLDDDEDSGGHRFE